MTREPYVPTSSGPDLSGRRVFFMFLLAASLFLSYAVVSVHGASQEALVPGGSQNTTTPHYWSDPKTGAAWYGTTPSPEEQEIIDQIRGPGYSPFPAPTPLAMDMAPEQPVYAYGAPVTINITFSNGIADSFIFPDFPPDLEISTRPDGWDKGIVRTLLHGEETLILKSHRTASTTLTWDQKNKHQLQVEPGVYYLTAQANLVQNITPASTTILSSFINARSEVIVQYPQGALSGTLFPNASITDGEVTATLDCLTFNERGGFANLTVIAPEPRMGSLSAPGFSQVTGEYRIDDGAAQNFHDYSERYAGKGVHQVRWSLAPVPCDAREIQITATTFDPYRGHWNFTAGCADIPTCAVDNETRFSREVIAGTFPDKPATTHPSPFPHIFTLAALALIGAISLVQKKGMR